eukprot:6997704-Alexandrium_andersonii.AAC.1
MAEQGLSADGWISLEQSEGFQAASQLLPCLTQASHYYHVAADRPLHHDEALVAQGSLRGLAVRTRRASRPPSTGPSTVRCG